MEKHSNWNEKCFQETLAEHNFSSLKDIGCPVALSGYSKAAVTITCMIEGFKKAVKERIDGVSRLDIVFNKPGRDNNKGNGKECELCG